MAVTVSRQFELRRRNYGDRARGVINDVMVALDLLTPDPALETRAHVKISRELFLDKEAVVTILVSHENYSSRQVESMTFRIHPETIVALFEHELIEKVRSPIGQVSARLTEIATLALEELLDYHDAMHVGHTLHLRAGMYCHFKGDDRIYNVHGVSTDTENGTLRVFYQPLYGEHYAKSCNRSLAMFTQVISRDGYLGPRWKLLLEQRPNIITRHQ